MKLRKEYLGDGLYVEDDDGCIVLSTQRGAVDHYVVVNDEVLLAFMKFLERTRKVEITVTGVG